ncbi:C-type lectin domain family 2 member D-like isoform X2 [Mauremys mutica]|uniref:C-type lectin domain family 2 member D-like isoform X2 n=1 Tax=Mauremys mutica TaxID=74926 RepID=UPI001D163504|nr:C-type lectin domain family 2 member D-like isoform X2 [Mauremys mutica]
MAARAISCNWLQADQSPAPTAASLRREMGNWAEADPLGQPLNSSIDLKSGEEPGHPANSSSRKPAVWDRPAALRAIIVVTMVVIIALVAALIVVTSKQPPPCPPAAPWCPDGWIRIQEKCYYFSKAEENWTYSQSFCSSHAASLAGIESPQELGSLLPYEGRLDHWIGLRKDMGQVWKWADGTEFDHWFEIHGGADCAQLDEDFTVVTSSCSTPRKWICSKPDTPAKREERAVGGDS